MAEKLRVLITGSNGLLGQKLVDAFLLDNQVEFLATARGENRHPQTETPYASMDITNPEQMDAVIDTFNPDVIIHTAAMTQVDDCEFEKGVDARNSAEAAVHTYQKDFDEVKDDLTEEERTKFETAVTELQESIKGEDKEDMTTKVTGLHEAVAPVFAAKQKKTESTTEENDNNVVEGEVTETA